MYNVSLFLHLPGLSERPVDCGNVPNQLASISQIFLVTNLPVKNCNAWDKSLQQWIFHFKVQVAQLSTETVMKLFSCRNSRQISWPFGNIITVILFDKKPLKAENNFYCLYEKLIKTKNDFYLLRDISLYSSDLILFICGPQRCGLILWIQHKDSILNDPGRVRSSFWVEIGKISKPKNVEFEWHSPHTFRTDPAVMIDGLNNSCSTLLYKVWSSAYPSISSQHILGDSQKLRSLRLIPDLLNQNLLFPNILKWFVCTQTLRSAGFIHFLTQKMRKSGKKMWTLCRVKNRN